VGLVNVSGNNCDLQLVFDGGSLGNPGKGYGSFHLGDRNGFETIERLEFGNNVTNNQAEYCTFIAGIEAALNHAQQNGQSPMSTSICVKTDSKLVVEQVNGRWKVKHPELQPLCLRARQLLAEFGRMQLSWQPRSQTVKLLGH
jgi:ribonuclease HI